MNKFLLVISLLLLSFFTYGVYAEGDHNSCLDSGFTPGTQRYTDCRIRSNEKRHADRLERKRQAHQEILEKERINREQKKIEQTIGTLGTILDTQQKKVCKKTSHGLKCGRMCLSNKRGEFNCGNVCKKNKWGNVKCGNSCKKDKWGEVECN